MPIYEYRCEDCGEPFEVFVRSVSKEAEVACPSCGSETVKRKLSTFASRSSGGGSSISLSSSAPACAPGGG